MRLYPRCTNAAVRRRAGFVVATLGLLSLSPLAAPAARAQSLEGLLGAVQGGSSGGGLPSLDQASTSNIAGVLKFCIQNNYLSGGSVQSQASSVLGKLTGSGEAPHDSGFAAGAKGLLQTDKDQSFALGGSGIKEQVTHEVCDMVLKHARSLT